MGKALKTGLMVVITAALSACGGQVGEEVSSETKPAVAEPAPKIVAKSMTLDAPLTAQTTDGVTIYGDHYFADLADTAPLILLFHQAGSNGRGEYGPLISWLNENGYRVIAWDQRSGGERFGSDNRTLAGMNTEIPNGYCDAIADLQAALDFVTGQDIANSVVVWGSSYSAALVFQLAAKNPDTVSGVLAFSPASGGPLAPCRARQFVSDIKSPVLALRPASEMERDSSIEQKTILIEKGVDFIIVDKGVHGSSMLVDERTENDMSAVRSQVIDWLNGLE